MSTGTRAIGIIRQSSSRGDDGASPAEQRKSLVAATKTRGLTLVEVFEELDVSGGTPLAKRRGLRTAVEMVERGEADVIVGAYFDRLVRSLKVQAEFVERVETAGGQVLALDTGAITNRTAGQWLSGTMLGAVSEYHRRTTAERVSRSHMEAIGRGVVPYPVDLPCYRKGDDGVLVVVEPGATAVAEAFALRANGGTIEAAQAVLASHGITRSYRAMQSMFSTRLVLGEIHFGEHTPNLRAHPPVVDRATWNAVQATRVPQGRKAKSPALLARLGVLRCGACDGPLVVGGSTRAGVLKYHTYRCSAIDRGCPEPCSITQHVADDVIVATVKAAAYDAEGSASLAAEARRAQDAAGLAAAALKRAIKLYASAGLGDDADAADELERLRTERDEADRRASLAASAAGVASITLGKDWESLSWDGRRTLIQAVVTRAVVGPAVPGAGKSRDAAAARITTTIALTGQQ
jgi:DNA invertase Pin-like site-specific DNA recombinase